MPEGFLSYFKDWEKKIGAFIEFKGDPVSVCGGG